MKADLFEALAGGATLLTANQRLARTQRALYNARRQAHGHAAWPSPDILPLSAWLQRCWETLAGDPLAVPAARSAMLLNPSQERAAWEAIVQASPEREELLQVGATAQSALEAWTLAREWRLPLDAADAAVNDDARVFLRWAARFSELCRDRAWLDRASLPDAIATCIAERTLPAPARLFLAGFDELTPQQQDLCAGLRAAGSEIVALEAAAPAARAVRVALADSEDELLHAATWARQRLAAGTTASIGVVVHNLGGVRARVERIFADVLQPGAVLSGGASARPFNISLGVALDAVPLIHDALLALELGGGTIALDRLGGLLRSPFFAGADAEGARRALLDAELRRLGELTVAVAMLARMARPQAETDAVQAWHCPQLAAHLARWQSERDACASRQTPSAWARSFSRLLDALGWPAGRTLDSAEHQALRHWRELLSTYASLDTVVAPHAYGEALARLRRLAGETVFQPKSAPAPIQVMGVLEAAGLAFDHLWVAGLHDEVWPASPRPNPFLPIALQRRHQVPHASAERELAFARRVTERLLASAPEVVVSHASREADRDLRPSPLLAALEARTPAQVLDGAAPLYRDAIQAAAGLENLLDESGPVLRVSGPMRGGTDVVAQQAACPFRAFARHRLAARALEAPGPGLDAAARGRLVHAVLERVWRVLQNHARLCAHAPEALHTLVQDLARQAVGDLARHRPFTLGGRFAELETARLTDLVCAWLEFEKTRAPFNVRERERGRVVEIDGLPLSIRIDRIDALPDGRTVLIDYKTGKPSVEAWFGARPDEPQLPVYAVTTGDSPVAVCFASLRRGAPGFQGLAAQADLLPGVADWRAHDAAGGLRDWTDLLHAWREVLAALAQAFRAGDARVDPKNLRVTCKYCELTPLCRVHEYDGLGEALEEDARA